MKQQIEGIAALISEGNKRIDKVEESAILILGKTGAGKSTLANLLVGRKLFAVSDKDGMGGFSITTNEPNAAKISDTFESETKIPNRLENANAKTVLWDCPGFADTNGVTQEIANGFYIHKLLASTAKVKFILTVSIHSLLLNRGTEFISVLYNFAKIFNNVEQIKDSVSLVVTQVQSNKTVLQVRNFLEKLSDSRNIDSDASISDTGLKESIKKLIGYLSGSIHVFHSPDNDGEVKLVEGNNIVDDINKTQYVHIDSKDTRVVVSQNYTEATLALFDFSKNNLISSLQEVAKLITKECDIVNASDNIITTIITKSAWLGFKKSTEVKISFKKMLNLNDICTFDRLCSDILQHDITLDQLAKDIGSLFEVLVRRAPTASEQEFIRHLEVNIKEKIEYVRFLKHASNGEDIDMTSLSRLFEQAAVALKAATAKGIGTIDINSEEDVDYYTKEIELINTPGYTNPKTDSNTSLCIYYRGNAYYREKQYVQAIEQYVQAIEKNKGDQGLDGIYDKITEIYFENSDFLNVLQGNSDINIKLFDLNNIKFNRIAQQVNDLLNSRITDNSGEFKWYPEQQNKYYKEIKYLDDLCTIYKDVSNAQQITISRDYIQFQNLIIKVLNKIKLDATDTTKKAIDDLCTLFTNQIECVSFFNKMLNGSKNTVIDQWSNLFKITHDKFKGTLITKIQAIKFDEREVKYEYFKDVIKYFGMLEKNELVVKEKAKVYCKIGELYEQNCNDEFAIGNYKEAIKYDNGLNMARIKIAKLLFKQEKYLDAFEYFKQAVQSVDAKLCLKLAIKESPNDPTIREKAGDYFCEIGMYHKAVGFYNDAKGIINNEVNARPLCAKIYNALLPATISTKANEFNSFANGTANIFPKTMPLAVNNSDFNVNKDVCFIGDISGEEFPY